MSLRTGLLFVLLCVVGFAGYKVMRARAACDVLDRVCSQHSSSNMNRILQCTGIGYAMFGKERTPLMCQKALKELGVDL